MKLFIKALILMVIPSIYAQNMVQGDVLDSDTHEPIPFASVYFPQLEKGSSTNENGHFIIEQVPAGHYKLVVSYMGYETYSQSITIPLTESISVLLKSSAIEMEEVIISTPFHKLQSENVMKVERQSVSELKSQGAVTLADGITNIAGVESVTTGTGIGKPVIRGLSSNRVLVYTQGVRLENQQFGSEHGLGVSDAGIESVEVIKGPSSLLYGSDALGGVLYLNPEKFANANTSQGDLGGTYFTNTLGYTATAGYKASGSKFKFLFRGSLSEHSDYDTPNYRVTNTRFNEKDFKAGIGFQDTRFKTEFRYNANHSKLGIPEELTLQSKAKYPMLPYQDLTNHVFSSKSTLFFNNSSLEFNLGYIYNNRQEFEEHHHHEEDHDHEDDEDHHDEEEDHDEDEELRPALHMKLKTFNYDVKYHLPKSKRIETIVGVQGMHQTNTNYGEEQLIPDATTNDFGVLGMTHIHFENVDVQLGARYDHRAILLIDGPERNFNSFNGAIGAKTNLGKHITARLNIASGFRAPNLAELTSDGVHHGSYRYEIGNFDLKNEQNVQFDLNLEYKSDHWELFANGFYNTINNYIFLTPLGEEIDEYPAYQYVQDHADLYGGEFGFHFHPHPLDWLHVESSFETVTGKQQNGDYLPLIPANSLNNTIRVEYNTSWMQKGFAFVRLKSTFAQNNVSPFETETDGYQLLGAGIGGTIQVFKNDMNLSISGTNLLNESYVNHLSRLKPDGINNMGRNIIFGVTYNL